MTRRTIILGISGLVNWSPFFWGFGGKRDWWRGAFLEWHLCLFLFIMVEFEKVLYSPDLKMVLTFSLRKSSKRIQCSNNFMFHSHLRFSVTNGRRQGFMVAWVCTAAPSPQKTSPLGSPVKIAFRRFLLKVLRSLQEPLFTAFSPQ